MASPYCIIYPNNEFFAQLSSWWPNMIKQFPESRRSSICSYNYGTLWMSGLNALSAAHARMVYVPTKWFQNKLVALLFCGSHHLGVRKQWLGNEKRPQPGIFYTGGETNSARESIGQLRLQAAAATPDSRSIPMRLVRKLAEIRLPLTKRRAYVFVYNYICIYGARGEPNTRIFVFVCLCERRVHSTAALFYQQTAAGCILA